jgi:hypothetical protein
MRRFLCVAFFLVACAGGQTQDPGATKGTGGIAGVSESGGSGGNATGGAGGDKPVVPKEVDGATGSGVGTCGNDVIDNGEQCDGLNLGAETCATLIDGSVGKLFCVNCEYDTSMCFVEDTGTTYSD